MPGIIIPTPEGGLVGIHGHDGTDWQRIGADDTSKLRVSLYGKGTVAGDTAISTGTELTGKSTLLVSVVGNAGKVIEADSNLTDSDQLGRQIGVASALFNGSTWDRFRNNVEATLLASAARTGTTSSADETNFNAKGVLVFFDITAVPGLDTVTLSIEAKDPVSGKYFTLLDGGAQSAVGQFLYAVYPGVADTEAKFDAFEEMPLPRTWRITVTHSGTGSFTYSVGASYIL